MYRIDRNMARYEDHDIVLSIGYYLNCWMSLSPTLILNHLKHRLKLSIDWPLEQKCGLMSICMSNF